jgi:hypothetical protein
MVSLAAGGGALFTADQWSDTYWYTSDTSLACSPVTPIPSPGDMGGAAFLDYDAAHNLLYASLLSGGLWRIVAP